jgi:hypothetical protein
MVCGLLTGNGRTFHENDANALFHSPNPHHSIFSAQIYWGNSLFANQQIWAVIGHGAKE